MKKINEISHLKRQVELEVTRLECRFSMFLQKPSDSSC